jgi:hypothetical protein
MRLSGTKTGAINQYRGLGNQLWDLAGNRPSLDLPFADNKSLVDATTGAQLVTFTRASSGTYVNSEGVIQIASTDEPRFDHDPTTGESLGLLVEEQRTNSITYSEQLETSPWTAFNATITANAASSPSNSNTADLLLETATAGAHFLYWNSVTAIETGAVSFFVKQNNRQFAALTLRAAVNDWVTCIYDLTGNGSVASTSSGVSSTYTSVSSFITAYPNNWYKISIVATRSGGLRVVYISPSPSSSPSLDVNGAPNYTGNTSSGIYLWGAQLEVGSFPTSYIPTTGAAATRTADVASISGSNFSSWYRQDEGTVFAEFRDSPSTQGEYPFAISDNTASNRFTFFTSGLSSLNSRLVSAGSGFNPGTVSFIASALIRACTAGKTGADQAITACNGVLSNAGSPTSMPAVDRMYIGGSHSGFEQTNGTIRRLTYWPARLPNETLQNITQ